MARRGWSVVGLVISLGALAGWAAVAAPAAAASTTAVTSTAGSAGDAPIPTQSNQLITVASGSAGSSFALLAGWQRQADGTWARVFGPMPARVGSSGIGVASEGSNTTPAGTYPLTVAFGRRPNPGSEMPYFQTGWSDWWDENPASPTYNLHVVQPDSPGGASENLYAAGTAYDYALNIGYNLARIPGAGSAFFLHVGTGSATAGCVSIDEGQLQAILRWLNPASHPEIDIRVGALFNPNQAVADGTLIHRPLTNQVYRVTGGAPVYVSSPAELRGGGVSATSVARWLALRPTPADGTLVDADGRVYVMAGGAPVYLTSWSAIGPQHAALQWIDPAAIGRAGSGGVWNHLRFRPVAGTFISGYRTGRVYRIDGSGAPRYVTSWADVGGVQKTTPVDQWTIWRHGQAGVYAHLA